MRFLDGTKVSLALPTTKVVKTAIVYRGMNACGECPESVGRLLKNSPYHCNVRYAGPDDEVDLSPELLATADAYVYPGGPDFDEAWEELKIYANMIRDFVHGGGRYMGFCLGAYLAGKSALNIMPRGVDIGSEILQDNSQVTDDEDSTIQVDWKFNASSGYPRLDKGRWMYFQEGATMQGFDSFDPFAIARYSTNQDVAALVTPYGRGFVGLVGPHPEAYELWYEDAGIVNPEGVRTDIGYDFVKSTMDGIRTGYNKSDIADHYDTKSTEPGP